MSKVMQIESKTEEILTTVVESINTSKQIAQTPQELAEQKINQQLASDQDYGAAAGALFALYGTRLYATVDSLSAKQLRRLIKALCVYPLEDQFINKKVPLEHSAYILANKMIESRFLITLYTGFEEEEKRRKAHEEYKAAQNQLGETSKNALTTEVENQISAEALNILDESVKNLNEGKAGDSIVLSADVETAAKQFMENNKDLIQDLAGTNSNNKE